MTPISQSRTSLLSLRRPHAVVLPVCLLLAACGGGGGGAGGPATTGDSVKAALNRLGVDTTPTTRETAPGMTMETTTSPLGRKPVLARTDELLLCNIGLVGNPNDTSPMLLLDLTDGNGAAAQELMFGQSATQVPFLPNSGPLGTSLPSATSVAVAADLDGNGLEEIVFVYQAGIETRVRRFDDETKGFVDSDVQIAANGNVTNVAAIAVDLDLDGKDELVLGITGGGVGRITAFRWNGTGVTQIGTEVTVAPDLATASLTLQVAAGNLDTDAAPELAVASQEVMTNIGSARYLVLDDIGNGLAVLRNELFSVRDQNQIQRVAYSASVAIGDIDGDGLGEVVLAGLTEFSTGCNSTQQLFAAFDDREHQFAQLGSYWSSFFYAGCSSPSNRRVRTIHLNALDIDGDGVDEIAANQFLFDDFVAAAPFTPKTSWNLPDSVVWSQNSFGYFDRQTSTFVVGDFTGDDRADLAVYRQDQAVVDVYGLPATSTATVRQRRVAVPATNSQTPRYPLLLPVNVDTDSPVLGYSEAKYKLVFSEPVVLAVLAAPPTKDGVGQNIAGSFTAFGNTTTTINEQERSVTFSAGVSVGVNLDGGPLTQAEFSLEATLNVAAERTKGTAYELSKTILFTSAPREDLVVFTSVPIDRYTYTILSHPDPNLVGQEVVVNYPRSPVTLQAERGFYNQSVPGSALKIDAAVFRHEVGKPATYLTVAGRNALLGTYGGLQIGPQAIGQGGGSTEVTLQVGSAISQGGSLSVGFERDIETTLGGVLVGTTIGVSSESSWRITSGTSTTYTGVVGAIEGANFAANRYSFGLFTYVYRDPATAQQFQVLNYWVEP